MIAPFVLAATFNDATKSRRRAAKSHRFQPNARRMATESHRFSTNRHRLATESHRFSTNRHRLATESRRLFNQVSSHGDQVSSLSDRP